MQSRNPVLNRYEGFRPGNYYQEPTQPQSGYEPGQVPNNPQGVYPPGFTTGQSQYPQQGAFVPANTPVMTIDDALTKSAVTMGVLIAVAAITMNLIPAQYLLPATIVTGLVSFVAVLIVSLRRVVNPAFVLAYAILEGVFIGAISKVFEYMYPGIVMPAVLGTFVTAGITLALYKFLRIRVTSRFRKMVYIGTASICVLYFLNFILSIFGIHMGIIGTGSGVGMLPILFSILGVGLAVSNLILDFDMIESGARNQLPAQESWRAALGLTVTMVWLYTELLRILSYFSRN